MKAGFSNVLGQLLYRHMLHIHVSPFTCGAVYQSDSSAVSCRVLEISACSCNVMEPGCGA